MRRLVAPLAVVALLAGCGGTHAAGPTIVVSATKAFVDAPPRVVVRGARAHARLIVRATTRDLGGKLFGGSVLVRADANGVARVPVPTLLSSLAPPTSVGTYLDVLPWAGQRVTITAAGRSAHFDLFVRAKNVALRMLHPSTDRLSGLFYRAPSKRPRPAVLLFGGSEGGNSGIEEGALLASRGFPTLSLAYFGLSGLPFTLSHIPLEYFERALRWLGRQPGVDAHRIVVAGASRGGEAALLLGATFPKLVHAVVALVPGNVVLDEGWTLHGRVIPSQSAFGPDGPHPIPVERFRGRVLLVCGHVDNVWPSCPMAEAVAERRRGLPTTLLEYRDAGHGIGFFMPNVPEYDSLLEGSSHEANAIARRKLWPKLLEFLRTP